MGHKITLIAPVYTDEDRIDKSLEPYCDRIIRVDAVKDRPFNEVEALYKSLNRPRFFFSGDGGFYQGIEDAFRLAIETNTFNAIIAEYSMMGQYIEANHANIPKDTTTIISVHEFYTKAFELRVQKGEDISQNIIKEMRKYELKMYGTADKVLALTKEDAEVLLDYAPNLRNKIRLVPHGVDTEFYTLPKRKSREKNTKNILYLGNFQHYPNVDAVKNFLKYTWNRVLEEIPYARFYAIGFNPPKELLDLRSEKIIVRGGGDSENVRQLYWSSDVFVAPIELGGGFRGKLLEAMACGLPIVATQRATFGISPVNKRDMFITDDYRVFSDYVIMLLKDKELRKEIGNNAFKLAKKFDHRNAAQKLDQVLQETSSN
jgi:glycosyltransferase involved in cell wall biosynthesis